jgi:pimeloyl-ACP methyl ester carboxylesterase
MRKGRRPRSSWHGAWMLPAIVLVVLVTEPWSHVRAASLLLRLSTPGAPTGLAALNVHEVEEIAFDLEFPGNPSARARLYKPKGVADPPGLVIVHGVHRLGVDEPRMAKFARAMASSGVVVLTPELKELADYRIDPRSIETIGRAAGDLAARVHRAGVGVLGFSFAGGLSLLAAADPRYAPSISFVAAVGAHDDVSRVSHFFATNEIADPDGHTIHLAAHEYGLLVLVYAHAEEFFSPQDHAGARDALGQWLWEDRDAARVGAKALSEAGQAKLALLFASRSAEIRPEILAVLGRHEGEMAAVSPHDHLGGMHVPVYLLHGAGDTVIPPSETSWLARDVPPAFLRNALISPAISHVELGGEPSAQEKLALVHFMSGLLDETAAERMR